MLAFWDTDHLDPLSVLPMLNVAALVIFAVMLFLSRKWKLNPILIMVLSGIAGLICYT